MNIRSITYFLNPGYPVNEHLFQQAKAFVNEAPTAFEAVGYPVQSMRMATPPFCTILPSDTHTVDDAVAFAKSVEQAAGSIGIAYTAIGPALPDIPASYGMIPAILAETDSIFASGMMGTRERGISLPAIRACAQIMHDIAPIDPNGFTNLFFNASADVTGNGSFFPSAYMNTAQRVPGFALAMEAAELAVTAFTQAATLAEATGNLTSAVNQHAQRLTSIGEELHKQFGLSFCGIDFTLAPFPALEQSLGTAFERLGVPAVGQHGSLAAASFIMDALDRATFQRTGFNGLMTPVLEDSTLALRASEGTLSIKDLLMYSAVCGTGLDTVPLPGDTTPAQLAAVLLDVASLSRRLGKPLTARLMPIPGKQAGEMTTFDFPFFANTRVLAIDAEPLTGLFAGDEEFEIVTRPIPNE
ncbi:MAG: DUF711 family protein [Chloroflexota bacterium]